MAPWLSSAFGTKKGELLQEFLAVHDNQDPEWECLADLAAIDVWEPVPCMQEAAEQLFEVGLQCVVPFASAC